MSLPAPRVGLVIRYDYLWSTDQQKGSASGSKERPCVIVLAKHVESDGSVRVIVAPITHSSPDDPEDSIEVPCEVAVSLGLDEQDHWVRVDELNSFEWPGFDLRPVPRTGQYAYGMMPKDLYLKIQARILERNAAKRIRPVSRDA